MAATRAVMVGSAAFTAAVRSAEKVAMPQRRGRWVETKATWIG